MNDIKVEKVKSGSYYSGFQHDPERKIYAGDIIVSFEYGAIRIEQTAMSRTNSISIIPKNLRKLIDALESIWAFNIEKKALNPE